MIGETQGPLARQMQALAFEYRMRTGTEATHILLPRRSPSRVKEFVEALVKEEQGIGSAPFVFDCFWRQERPAQFAGFEIAMANCDDVIVGGDQFLH